MALLHESPSLNAVHSFVELPTGVLMHFVQKGQGVPVILCHGWPDFWYGWRHQINKLAEAGFHVIVPDQRGFGQTKVLKSNPQAEDYSQQKVTSDLLALMDLLLIQKAVFIGHDWGGAIVWAMSIHYPERVIGVGALCTPFVPPNPNKNPMDGLKSNPRQFDYQLYFQEKGVAEKEMSQNSSYLIKCMHRGASPNDKVVFSRPVSTSNVRERGGMLVGYPEDSKLKRSEMMTAEDLDYYAKNFDRSGFEGGMNWYRNIERNWEWSKKANFQGKISVPCLMVTAGRDGVLKPEMSAHMELFIENLQRGHVELSGHFIQEEHPKQINEFLVAWLHKNQFHTLSPSVYLKKSKL
eukprot:TRINITY_DN2632_c0_g1_i1.p1 TRINITY_DN2632_c0_g1~~TRINITY_DN2632_c0_g1_i1.p1  ORF type:complete len:365 (-),score=89.10 TRINITY_DN2632_c0_g1_i1:55-1107(-)